MYIYIYVGYEHATVLPRIHVWPILFQPFNSKVLLPTQRFGSFDRHFSLTTQLAQQSQDQGGLPRTHWTWVTSMASKCFKQNDSTSNVRE